MVKVVWILVDCGSGGEGCGSGGRSRLEVKAEVKGGEGCSSRGEGFGSRGRSRLEAKAEVKVVWNVVVEVKVVWT